MAANKVLALDLGPTSIGWSLLDESREVVLAVGVRVFPEGVDRDQTGGEVPKNQQRRLARGVRRQIARRARRKRLVREALVLASLLPPAAFLPASHPDRRAWETAAFRQTDPYFLRRRALEEKLEPHELGRLFLHLAQRRGFLSNRKADRQKKEDDSKMLEQINQLQAQIKEAGHRTLGEHLARTLTETREKARGRHTYRQMYLDEFDAVWAAQKPHHPDLLTDILKEGTQHSQNFPCPPASTGGGAKTLLERFGLRGMIFFQRPMYWPKSVIGRCELDPREKRCPRADRAAQEFRVLLEVNNLRVIGPDGEVRDLNEEERDKLLSFLAQKKEASFDEVRKKLSLAEGHGFNLEAGDRKKLQGMPTDALLSSKKYFGKAWVSFPDDKKDAIVRSLIDGEEAPFLARASQEWNIDPELAQKLLDAPLPEGYSSYGLSTIQKLLPFVRGGMPLLSREDAPYAVRAAGFLPPWERAVRPGQFLPEPPKLTNPIVRQALFEVRKLVNAVIREFGKPDAVHVELAREVKGTAIQRARQAKDMRARQRRREDAAERIREFGDKPTHNKIDRYLLWEEQREICIYSGRTISLAQLMGGEVDIDHVLPYSQSLDDSLMNKVVCFRSENADKGQRTVHQWLAAAEPEKYQEVLQRAARLPLDIRNRKLPRFSQKTCELNQFLNRQLTDTAYITSMVLDYLRCLGVDILASKGQLTAELRHQWGLNSILNPEAQAGLGFEKSRDDHRHHAVDALVIALTNRSRLQALARRKSEHLPPPWPSFRDDAARLIAGIHVSHRASRRIAGALHEATFYGATQKVQGGTKDHRPHARDWIEQDKVFVLRKPLESLSLNEVDKIRDPRIKEIVLKRLADFGLMGGRKKRGAQDEGEAGPSGRNIPKEVWKEPLYLTDRKGKRGTATRILKVRLVKPEESIIPLNQRGDKFVKPGNLHHVEIYELTDPKGKTRREAVFVSMLEAAARVRNHQPLIQRTHPEYPQARFVMSLSRGECVQGLFKGKQRLVRFSTAASTQGQLYFLDHTDARPSASVVKFAVKANTLNGSKVHVDHLGRIHPAND